MDYDSFLKAYAEDKVINTVIEITKDSTAKIEYDRDNKAFMLDRVEPSIFAKPGNYGFIPNTLDDDGDALDTLVLCEESIPMGVYLRAKVVGVLKFEDDGEMDHKILCVPEDDRNIANEINDLADVSATLLKKIEHHFTHYKDLKKPGSTISNGWGDAEEAHKIIEECIQAWNK